MLYTEVHMQEAPSQPGDSGSVPSFRPEMAFPLSHRRHGRAPHGYGHAESFVPDTQLWSRGDREVDMFVVLEGTIEVYEHDSGGQRKAIATLHQRQFSGELDLLSSRPHPAGRMHSDRLRAVACAPRAASAPHAI